MSPSPHVDIGPQVRSVETEAGEVKSLYFYTPLTVFSAIRAERYTH
jgi:hypothetical protein